MQLSVQLITPSDFFQTRLVSSIPSSSCVEGSDVVVVILLQTRHRCGANSALPTHRHHLQLQLSPLTISHCFPLGLFCRHCMTGTLSMGSTQEAVKQSMCACRLHDRMPVLLTCDEHADAWLGTEPLSTKYVRVRLLAVSTMCLCISPIHLILVRQHGCSSGNNMADVSDSCMC